MQGKILVPAMMALVEAIAGMMFLTTPCVSDQVTPSILNSWARRDALLNNQSMCSGSSVSIFLSTQKEIKEVGIQTHVGG